MGEVEFATIVMAAGQGTRMKSSLPKVLHEVAGWPLYAHVVNATLQAGSRQVVVVVGHGRELVSSSVAERFDERVATAVQQQQRGTGDATRVGLDALSGWDGWVVILSGDTPLLHRGLVEQLMKAARAGTAPLAMVTSHVEDPGGYGRVLRGSSGEVLEVVEHADASEAQRAIREVNTAVYAAKADFLREALATLGRNNAQGELYLTDIVARAAQQGGVATLGWDFDETQGVNDRAQLADCERAMRLRIARELARQGVTVRDPATAYIEAGVEVAADAVLEPNVHLRGHTRVGARARIGTGAVLENVEVAEDAVVKAYTVATDSRIGKAAETGPFSHLRPQSELAEGAKIGNFVEMKQTRLGKGSKANHLSYLGNGEIGANVNIGAGTIFCNYDGFLKYTTTLEDEVFIGSDSQLVAPVRVGRGAYVATGTTVTEDVSPDALALSRGRQIEKPGYAARLRARLAAEKAKRNE